MTLALFESAGISNKNDEWYTPSWLFESLGVEFDLDPCSPGTPPSSVPAKRHLTKEANGLAEKWAGAVWLNPPFSSKRTWYERLIEHGNGIALMPARTETHDFQDYMSAADALLFLKGRIYFERGSRPGANGNGVTSTPPFGIVLCAYGPAMAEALIGSKLLGVRSSVVRDARDVDLLRSDRRARGALATMCETVMTRVVELEELDSPPAKVVAKKLRAAVLAATD